MTETTFWVAIPHEIILALSVDHPVAARIVAASAACVDSLPEHLGKRLGAPEKIAVRRFYQRQRELAEELEE